MRNEDNAQEYVQAWYDAHKLWEMDTQEKIDNLAQMVLSAILAEREACANLAETMTIGETQEIAGFKGRNVAAAIRARSNAPESPNKALESSENLQSSAFPASVMKTCS